MAIRDVSIQRKLMTIILLTSGAVLLLTCSTFSVYELVTFRETTVRKLSTLAEVIATNSTASLAFQAQSDAEETLAAVKADSHITSAILYDGNGKVFARYPANLPISDVPLKPERDGYRFERSYLVGW